jgi:SAM-dependent methyltransferase
MWDRLALMVYERRHPNAPWLTEQASRFLDDWLRPDDEGLEWGSGRSTAWLGARVKKLVSIEHDRAWYDKVAETLRQQGLRNVEYHLVPTDQHGSDPHAYVGICATIPAASLDFVLVDGVLRDLCAEAALDLLKVGGLLVLDNSNWYLPHATRSPSSVGRHGTSPTEIWLRVAKRLEAYRLVWTSSGVTDTAFFVKTT